jgi:hypothetical protein
MSPVWSPVPPELPLLGAGAAADDVATVGTGLAATEVTAVVDVVGDGAGATKVELGAGATIVEVGAGATWTDEGEETGTAPAWTREVEVGTGTLGTGTLDANVVVVKAFVL